MEFLKFLSIQAQDFIEECCRPVLSPCSCIAFLSIQAQDFIEDQNGAPYSGGAAHIPEHSSSGLH